MDQLRHRPDYEQLLKSYQDTKDIKVLTGVRRCGKSSLLQLLMEDVRSQGVPDTNIFLRRFDQFGVPLHPTAQWLLDQLQAAAQEADHHQTFYVFLDEIQDVEDWQKVVRRLHTQPNVDIYLTGSNAHVLSGDLATLLGGRYVEIPVFPLSFVEYLDFGKEAGLFESNDDALDAFITYGGMPMLFDMPKFDERYITRALDAIYETVILNDVAMHASISSVDLLSRLTRYLFASSGNLFSTRKIAGYLTSGGRKTAPETVDAYIRALCDAHVLYECEQTGLAGKKVLRPLRKFYPVDTGLRNLVTGFAPDDLGFQLEDVVYVELLRRGWSVSVGRLDSGEVDFVAQRPSEKTYYQVSETVLDQTVYERELKPLNAIGDAFQKVLLVRDSSRTGTTKTGIKIVSIKDWLTEK